ncbi:MAG: hypothetical protein MI867_15655, partial [Pseudomonadales bacterium]|nr:hypothetical protein [Pseudomonadales bacterium]
MIVFSTVSVRGTDLYVSKLTADGQEIWTDLYDFGGKSESVWGVAVDQSQGTIYAAGTGFIAVIDRFGNLLWSSNGVS